MRSVKPQRSTPELLRWLTECGCPVDILGVESSIRIEQQLGDDVTHLFELPDSRTGCILDLRVVNEGPGQRSIRDLEFTMPWSDFGFRLLEDPKEMGGGRYTDLYCFPGTKIEYHRHMVLNHVLLPNGILQPNSPKSGLLLGIGNPMPPEILTAFTGVLRLSTDGGTTGTCEIALWADRTMSRAKSNKRPPQYDGLYGTKIRSERGRDGYIRTDTGKQRAEKEQ